MCDKIIKDRDRRKRIEHNDHGERMDTMGTNVYSSKDNKSMHKSLNGEFLLYQVLVDRILNGEKKINENRSICEYFQPEDPIDKKIMKEFDNEYDCNKAIHWYTRETCIYKILNKALRTQNINDVAAFAQFVKDLNQQLEKEKIQLEKQFKTSILTVYRGQLISKDEVNRLKTTIGQLLSMNSFLSTSTNKEKALEFAKSRCPPNDQLTSIILEINVNIKSPSKPFADIRHLSAFSEEEEILFMFGCVFRIDDVWFDQQINIWKAKLALCNESDSDLKQFVNSLQQELNGKNQLIAIGNYLIEMQKYEDAQEHYLNLLDENIFETDIDLAYCYQGLAQVYDKKGNYQQSIKSNQICLNYLLKQSIDDHLLFSQCYNHFGSLYSKLFDYPQAFYFYEKALTTKNNQLSLTYQGLAQIHSQLQNYHLAIEYLQKSLDSQLETDWSSIANNYISMGKIYGLMNIKDKASQMFDKALENQLKILNDDHPDIGYTYLGIASMYCQINEFDCAFEYVEKASQLQLNCLPGNHSDFALTYSTYGEIYLKQNQFDQSLIYYKKSLENQLKSLLWNHPSVTKTYLTIGFIYSKINNLNESFIYFHKVLDNELETKQFGDPTLSQSFKRLADLYFQTNQIDKCLIYSLQFIENELHTKFIEDSSFIEIYQRIGQIYLKKHSLAEALVYFQRLLDCHLKKQTFDKNEITIIYSFIGKVYLKINNFDQSRLFSNQTQIESKDKLNKNLEKKYFQQRHFDQQWNYFVDYLQQQYKILKETDPFIGDTYQILANIAFQINNYSESLKYFLKLLNNKLTRRSIDGSSLSNIYKSIANLYFIQNQLNLSLNYFNRLIDCRIKKTRSIHQTYEQIAKIYLIKHNFEQLIQNENSFSFQQQENSIKKSKSHSIEINNIQFKKRHLQMSLIYFHNLLNKQLRSNDLSLNKYSLEDLYTIISILLFEREDYEQSLSYLKELVYLQLSKHPQGNIQSANTYAVMSYIYLKQNLSDLAIYYSKQALQIFNRHFLQKQNIIKLLKSQIRLILIPHI